MGNYVSKQKYWVHHTRTQKHIQNDIKYKPDEDIYSNLFNYIAKL